MAGAVAIDNSVVHPAITAVCAAVNATPVAVIPASAPASGSAPAAASAPAKPG